jgi:hypothetical protein
MATVSVERLASGVIVTLLVAALSGFQQLSTRMLQGALSETSVSAIRGPDDRGIRAATTTLSG